MPIILEIVFSKLSDAFQGALGAAAELLVLSSASPVFLYNLALRTGGKKVSSSN